MNTTDNDTNIFFDKNLFHKHHYHDRIFLDFIVLDHFGYDVNRHIFRFYEPLKIFLDEFDSTTIYLTNNSKVINFIYYGQDILVNIDNYINFCEKIGDSKRDKSRAVAFFGQHLSVHNIMMSEDDKNRFIEKNLSEHHLLKNFEQLSLQEQLRLLGLLNSISKKVSNPTEKFLKSFTEAISNEKIQDMVLENLPLIQLSALMELKDFVAKNLDKNETFFQDWLDEENGKFRKKRCLIFGMEFLDPKREGEIMGRKRFDILATQNRDHHILIELKSPTAKIFDIDLSQNGNGGITSTYKLSKELSRAIPQILGYKRWYYELSSEKIQELGISSKKKISECIIVIGTHNNSDIVWKENFKSLSESLNIKIWTYTDLIEKMENTIKNLQENLF